jgi:predicted nucleic acid-binding protein
MGLSKWDLLDYTGQTNVMEVSKEVVTAKKRLDAALNIFSGKGSKILFFDAGPIITLAMSRLLWVLKPLKEKFGGKFYITEAVRKELVENPIKIPRFEFEALQVMKLIREGTIELYPKVAAYKTQNLAKLSNHTYRVNEKWMEIIQAGEMETVIASLNNNSTPIIMDERTMRLLIEDGKALKSLLERRTHKSVEMDQASVDQFHQMVGKMTIIRSIELAAVAYKFGILDAYLPHEMENPKEKLLTAVLWNTKYNGCAVTEAEIAELKGYLIP